MEGSGSGERAPRSPPTTSPTPSPPASPPPADRAPAWGGVPATPGTVARAKRAARALRRKVAHSTPVKVARSVQAVGSQLLGGEAASVRAKPPRQHTFAGRFVGGGGRDRDRAGGLPGDLRASPELREALARRPLCSTAPDLDLAGFMAAPPAAFDAPQLVLRDLETLTLKGMAQYRALLAESAGAVGEALAKATAKHAHEFAVLFSSEAWAQAGTRAVGQHLERLKETQEGERAAGLPAPPGPGVGSSEAAPEPAGGAGGSGRRKRRPRVAAEDARFAKDVRRKVDRALREVDHLQISAAAAGLTAATALLNAWQSRRDRELEAREGAISAEALGDAIHLEDLVHEAEARVTRLEGRLLAAVRRQLEAALAQDRALMRQSCHVLATTLRRPAEALQNIAHWHMHAWEHQGLHAAAATSKAFLKIVVAHLNVVHSTYYDYQRLPPDLHAPLASQLQVFVQEQIEGLVEAAMDTTTGADGGADAGPCPLGVRLNLIRVSCLQLQAEIPGLETLSTVDRVGLAIIAACPGSASAEGKEGGSQAA